MTTAEVLEACRGRVALRLVAGELRQSGASADLLAELKAHREELRAVLGARAWPFLGHPGFDLQASVCGCGNRPYLFTEAGEPRCKLCVSRFPWPGWEAA